jgi:hypothetical protein
MDIHPTLLIEQFTTPKETISAFTFPEGLIKHNGNLNQERIYKMV